MASRFCLILALLVASAAPAVAQEGLPLPQLASSLDAVRTGASALSQGSRGVAVRDLQRLLNATGATLATDGVFGPGTRAAVVQFQRSAGLTADGVVGPATLRALEGRPGGAGGATAPAPSTPPSTAPEPLASDRALSTIPARRSGAPGGRAILAATAALSMPEREARLVAELEQGNLPGFLRRLQPVTFSERGRDGATHTVRVWVLPDYLAVGSDADFVRVPLTPGAAQRVADRFGCVLPTPKLVDAIYAQAAVKLAPSPLPPTSAMTSNAYTVRHQEQVERQWAAAGGRRGALTAGHKKDVVNSARLASRRDRVAIYGWHRTNGRPIQPVSTVHGSGYADYSHGIRLIYPVAEVDGQPTPVTDLLRDPVLWPLLSNEGRLAGARLPGTTPVAPLAPSGGGLVARLRGVTR